MIRQVMPSNFLASYQRKHSAAKSFVSYTDTDEFDVSFFGRRKYGARRYDYEVSLYLYLL